MTRILGLPGSLRASSYNAALLRAAAELAPDGMTIEVGSLAGIPLYDGDDEAANGLPGEVVHLQERLAAADGLLLVTPEYNSGVPGVLKNAIDWMSRGERRGAFTGKPVAIMGASTGGFGSILGQTHWLPVLRALRTRPWFGSRLTVSGAAGKFGPDGALTDEGVRDELRAFLAGFAESLGAGTD